LDKKVKTQQQQQNKKSNIKTVAGIEHGTSCTQSGCVTTAALSQLFRRNGSKRKQSKPNLRARHFQQIHFSVIFLHA